MTTVRFSSFLMDKREIHQNFFSWTSQAKKYNYTTLDTIYRFASLVLYRHPVMIHPARQCYHQSLFRDYELEDSNFHQENSNVGGIKI